MEKVFAVAKQFRKKLARLEGRKGKKKSKLNKGRNKDINQEKRKQMIINRKIIKIDSTKKHLITNEMKGKRR